MIFAGPWLLATQIGSDCLPIHYASKYGNSEVSVPLLATVGLQHAIGGVDARGGLVMLARDQTLGLVESQNCFVILVKKIDAIAVFEALRNANSGPLSLKKDVGNSRLAYHLIGNCL